MPMGRGMAWGWGRDAVRWGKAMGRFGCPRSLLSAGAVHRQLPEVHAGDRAVPAHPPLGGEDRAAAAGTGRDPCGQGAGVGRGLAAPSWRLSLLCLQEERATFDIHGYGDTLASSCRRLGEWRSFASLVAGEPPFEVCRYMLATLQLVSVWGAESRGSAEPTCHSLSLSIPLSPQANDSVVELAQGPGLEEALDTARLRFLTHQRPQERFHTFQPPSACP